MTSFEVPAAVGAMQAVRMDPALANRIGLHHTLASAVADLVDNSIDARARAICIRILLASDAPVGLQVIDDGRGMDLAAVDAAMMYAGTRQYGDTDLGHFGVGLKAASLSQADTVLICSRARGATPVGRKLIRSGDTSSPLVGELNPADVEARIDGVATAMRFVTGTLIEWRDVRTFPSTRDPDEQRRWLQDAMLKIRNHLGVVFHRLLARPSGPRITLETWDVVAGAGGIPRRVEITNPFAYPVSGDPDFPQRLRIDLPDGSEPVRAVVHVWPARSQAPEFKLGGDPGVKFQGIFAYRRDRLLQIGGWCGLWADRPGWELARIALDIVGTGGGHATINPEKSGLTLSADLRRALETATCVTTGENLLDYLDVAAGVEKRGRARQRQPITVVEPDGGLPDAVLRGYGEAVEFDRGVPPIAIRWRWLQRRRVFDVDREKAELVLNRRYREALVGWESEDPDDAPVLKTLLHLLTNQFFQGTYLGPRGKAELAAWQEILYRAVHAQIDAGLGPPKEDR
ncbi:ATP-binding protein [Pseudofrankia inefficax]|uniref:ATP-binding region ATPase domain protein n=1 Tax=Pseudofrankia inefficax (strain DSM 45817 / CECT 9037 / DDB 130130 / EuI1c) TaxID=298654 RepID=E3JC95_PSEI1|nr:ATP-binding protein [Pseudofrankia inefficax]ADP84684.1 ATP-binding region ATPase domain protein [Pseudofrankia inefficax]